MQISDFVSTYCITSGGNWTQMLASGIKAMALEGNKKAQKIWDDLPDSFSFSHVRDALSELNICVGEGSL